MDDRRRDVDAALPEPTTDDIARAVAAQTRLGETALVPASGEERCGACRCFLTPDATIAYCWHPTQRALVDAGWVCDAFSPDRDR